MFYTGNSKTTRKLTPLFVRGVGHQMTVALQCRLIVNYDNPRYTNSALRGYQLASAMPAHYHHWRMPQNSDLSDSSLSQIVVEKCDITEHYHHWRMPLTWLH